MLARTPHNLPPTSDFHKFWDLGYRRLLPIAPPGCSLSPNSVLAKRMTKPEHDPRGKVPAARGDDGLWRGISRWQDTAATEEDLDRWAGWGAGVGLLTGDGLLALDIDVTDEASAGVIADMAEALLGVSQPRIGRAPKRTFLLRCDDDVPSEKLWFATPAGDECVEVLAAGRQTVVAGIHPKTGQPYSWPAGVPAFDDLPVISAGDLSEFCQRLFQAFPQSARSTAATADRAGIDQTGLEGDPALVRSAVGALPNTDAAFPTRDDYLRVGIALKAALPGDEAEALDLFLAWCGRWDGGSNDVEVAEEDFARMKPPFSMGAGWLYDMAERHGGWTGRASALFADCPEILPTPFSEVEGEAAAGPLIKWTAPTTLEGVEPTPRKWIVEGFIPDNEVTLWTGHGGLGKTLGAQQLLTACATGTQWLGQTVAHCRGMGFFCEDDDAELHRRQVDLNAALGVTWRDLDGLRYTSRKRDDNALALFDRGNGALTRTKVFEQLVIDARRFGARLVVLDGLSDVFTGNENDRYHVKSFVNAILSRLAAEIGGAVVLLAHPSKTALANGDGYSGSTAWTNAVRSLVYMHRPEEGGGGKISPTAFVGKSAGDVRKLENKKLNYGRMGSSLTVRWERGAFVATSAALLLDGVGAVEVGEGAGLPTTDGAAEEALLAGLRRDAGATPMSLKSQSRARGDLVLANLYPKLVNSFTRAELRAAFERLSHRRAFAPVSIGVDEHRHERWSLRVVEEAEADDDLFN